jgi:hypothetical protein
VQAAGQAQLGVTGAEDADHHRLHHRQREQRRHRGVHGVAPGGEHLGAGGRGQRMVGDHHAADGLDRAVLGLERGARARAPAHLAPAANQEFQK